MPPRRRPMPIVLLFIRVPLLLPLPLRPSILLLLLLPVVRDMPIPMVGLLIASADLIARHPQPPPPHLLPPTP